jgi:DNA-binding GntR family transcriptional regulator
MQLASQLCFAATSVRLTGVIATPDLDDLPLRDQAYRTIKKQILDEGFAPNTFLSERALSEQLGMSKTPVRLAIARLENEGFVRVSPQQGIVVLALSFEDILDYIDYRLALETFVVKQITGALSATQVQGLKDNIAEQHKLVYKKGTPAEREAMIYSDMAFHRYLVALSGNRQILQAIERQQDMLYRVAGRVFQKHPARREASFLEHQTLVGHIIKGQTAKALELIEAHITRIKSLLIGTLG